MIMTKMTLRIGLTPSSPIPGQTSTLDFTLRCQNWKLEIHRFLASSVWCLRGVGCSLKYSVVCTLPTNTVTSTRLQNYLHTTAVWSSLATWHIGNVWHFVKLSLAKILFSANFPRHLSHFDLVCWRGLSGFEQVITDVPMWHICHFWHVTHCHIPHLRCHTLSHMKCY